MVAAAFFLQNNLLIPKNGTQRTHKTNHYILLTNISIKRCIRPRLKPIYSGGGEEFQPDKYLTDSNKFYPSHIDF